MMIYDMGSYLFDLLERLSSQGVGVGLGPALGVGLSNLGDVDAPSLDPLHAGDPTPLRPTRHITPHSHNM